MTIFPNDFWRIDLGATRSTLDNITSLNRGLAVDSFGGSVDYWPTGNTKLTGRAYWSDYSDGNQRWWVQAEARHRFFRGPDIWLGARATAFDFAEQLNNGYFNPDRLRAIESTLQIWGNPFGETTYELFATAGYENAEPDPGKFIWSAGVTLRHPVTESIDIEAQASHASSALGSDSGFERTSIGLGLGVQW